MIIERSLRNTLNQSLKTFPALGIIGARQVGKTTLAKRLARDQKNKAVYLDLELPSDLAKLHEPELYLQQHSKKLVILDEVHRLPELFPVLRALIDQDRHAGRFLILGSASPELLRQSSESLAGRIIYHELPPLTWQEVKARKVKLNDLWLKGGFPDSLLTPSSQSSWQWRKAFLETFFTRDLPSLGVQVSPDNLRVLWSMLAHSHGQLWNASKMAGSLGTSAPTVRSWLEILQQTFLVRTLPPYHLNLKKRLVKSPKVYIRDTGLLHMPLGIADWETLQGHPALGASWESFILQEILAMMPSSWTAYFYRTHGGAELDLLLEAPGGRRKIAVEIKYTSQPAVSRGMRECIEDLQPAATHVVCPVEESFPLGNRISATPVEMIPRLFE